MDTAVPQQQLQEIFNQVTLEVTEQMGGIRLHLEQASPDGEDVCTVHAAFERGFRSSLSLCAETAMFVRLTQYMMGQEEVEPQDVEDFTREYFNVICGHIAASLFRLTKIPSRFGIPAFYRGRFRPEGQTEQFVLRYSSDHAESAQLTHHVPV